MRTYSVECPELMRMLLHHTTANSQISWLLGVWIGRDAAANVAQVCVICSPIQYNPAAAGLYSRQL
jgi:exo-beta-1,3-glucanase (GH17 family)